MKKQPKYSPEVIERAVRMVSEAASEYSSQWAAIEFIAAKMVASSLGRASAFTFQNTRRTLPKPTPGRPIGPVTGRIPRCIAHSLVFPFHILKKDVLR
jgi:hypothetical protein